MIDESIILIFAIETCICTECYCYFFSRTTMDLSQFLYRNGEDYVSTCRSTEKGAGEGQR